MSRWTRVASGVANHYFRSARYGPHLSLSGREDRPSCAPERLVLCRMLDMDFGEPGKRNSS